MNECKPINYIYVVSDNYRDILHAFIRSNRDEL